MMTRRVRRRQNDFPLFVSDWPDVSVVIVTYKTGGRFVAECLESLRRLDYPGRREVIVVDNASDDETREALGRCVRDETVILNETNRGFAGGCNDGVARASGQVIVLLNFDTTVSSDWLREIVRPFRSDPRAAIVGCKIFYPGSRLLQHAGGELHGNGMGEHIGYRQEDAGAFDQTRDVDFVTGAAMAIRREFLDLCGGGLDEDFYPAYSEDVDLCFRAHLMGYRVLYEPRATLEHFESPTLDNQSADFQRMVNRGRVLFCIKNYRVRDWLARFIPYEWYWLHAPWSRGLRRRQLRAYLDGFWFFLGRRYSADRPFPRRRDKRL